MITSGEPLKTHITKYYKNLFGPPENSDFVMDDGQRDDIPQVTQLENDFLTLWFTEDEVRTTIFGMEHNKALGPDGFPTEFYPAFWHVIKPELMALFVEFHKGTLPLYNINFGTIILLPKYKEALLIQQYRPICLLNISFKVFTKVVTNRIMSVAQKVISPTQTTFILGRNIMEGVVILHETMHELHRKKQSGVIFKSDFEKVYNKVKWSFVQQTLRMKGFFDTWCSWIDTIISRGQVAIKINDQLIRVIFSNKERSETRRPIITDSI
jgi:hypothetical protein